MTYDEIVDDINTRALLQEWPLGETTTMPEQTNSTGKRTHKATYAKDKKGAGYNVRVVGPQANEFAGYSVPVETKSGEEHTEKLINLLWSGADTDPVTKEATGYKAALYSFEARPKEVTEPVF